MEKLPKTAVRIPCNATVKNYTVATLQRLGLDAGPGKVYNKLMSGEGVVPKANKEVNDLVDLLLKKIPLFLPPVPPTAAEIGRYKEFNQKWSENIQKMKQSQFTPVYLRDEVNKVLERKQYPQRCKRIHLVWCLSLKGEKHMTPEKIADAIIEYDGTDWDNMPPLKNDAAYHVRLATATDKEKEKFLDTVEFIYALSSKSADPNLVEKLQNDLEVLSEIDEWKDNLTTYKYAERYKELVSRLQTAPGVPQKKRGARKNMKPAASPEPVLLQQQQSDRDKKEEGQHTTETVDMEQQKESPELPGSTDNVPSSETAAPEVSDNDEHPVQEPQQIEDVTIDGSDNEPTDEELANLPTDGWWRQNYQTVQNWLEGFKPDDYGKRIIKEGEDNIIAFSQWTDFDIHYEDMEKSFESSKPNWPVKWIMRAIETKLKQREEGII
ncbi:MAG: hypothetical protein IJV09_02640 [Prevotella sp.]|nr:hypothetical protein [Prevotella sp.]